MNSRSNEHQPPWRRSAIAAMVVGAFSIAATTAYAGECPADQRVADGKGQKLSTATAKDVTDVVRATTDLSRSR